MIFEWVHSISAHGRSAFRQWGKSGLRRLVLLWAAALAFAMAAPAHADVTVRVTFSQASLTAFQAANPGLYADLVFLHVPTASGTINDADGVLGRVTLSAAMNDAPVTLTGQTPGAGSGGYYIAVLNATNGGNIAQQALNCFTTPVTAFNATGYIPNGGSFSITASCAGPAATVPGAPTIGTATAGNGQASVSFAAPASNGGAAITSYTATSSPGGRTGSCAASPCVVAGLTNGSAYTFTVTATNSAGTGAASAPSNEVTPKGTQTITFGNPGTQLFGTTLTLTAAASSNLAVTFTSGTPSVCTITAGGALTFVSVGTCTINASQPGNGAFLAAPVVSQSFAVNPTAPGAPTIGTVVPGDRQASVSFTPPASNGGAAITSYTVTSSPGGITASCSASPCTVTGLVNGTGYTFAVQAVNGQGAGNASATSAVVVPVLRTLTLAGPEGPIVLSFTSTDAGCTFADASAASVLPAPPTGAVPADAGFSFPQGLLDFAVTACASGAQVNATAEYQGIASIDGAVFRKYGLVNGQPAWQTFGTVAGSTVSLTLTDGGAGDADGQRDGTIRDPGGLAKAVPAVPTLGGGVLALLAWLMGVLAWVPLQRHRRPL